jgi:hypothetical protein
MKTHQQTHAWSRVVLAVDRALHDVRSIDPRHHIALVLLLLGATGQAATGQGRTGGKRPCSLQPDRPASRAVSEQPIHRDLGGRPPAREPETA